MNEKKVFLLAVILSLLSLITGLVQISILQMAVISQHREKRKHQQRLFSYSATVIQKWLMYNNARVNNFGHEFVRLRVNTFWPVICPVSCEQL